MAGTFPDVPGHRFMYDQDGTIVLSSPSTASSPLTVIDPLILNDEDDSDQIVIGGGSGGWKEFTWAFPEPRSITGFFAKYSASLSGTLSYSTDTTDGTDGTWQSYGSVSAGMATSYNPYYRTSIIPLSISDVRGVRIRFTQTSNQTYYIQSVHLYGTIPTAESTDRLEFWQPSANSVLDKAGLDFGDVPLGSVTTKQFRVKNLSSSLTATSVVVSANNLAGGTQNDAMVSALEFSTDGSTWGPSATIDEIAPEAISSVVSVRRTVGLAEDISPRFARIMATPGEYA